MSRRRHGRHSTDVTGPGTSALAPDVSQVGIRELARNVSGVVAEVTRTGRPTVVTKHGLPVAAVVPIDAADLDAATLARASSYVVDLGDYEVEEAGAGTNARFADQLTRLAEALRLPDHTAQRVP